MSYGRSFIRRGLESQVFPREEFATRFGFRVFDRRTHARAGEVELSAEGEEGAFSALRSSGLVAYEGYWFDKTRPFRPWRKIWPTRLTEILLVCIELDQEVEQEKSEWRVLNGADSSLSM